MSPASRLKRALALTIVTAAAAGATLTATAPAATASTSTPRFVNGWLPWWNMAAANGAVMANADIVGMASPFWYYTDATGAIKKKAKAAGDPVLVKGLQGQGVKVVPSVTDGASASETLKILGNATTRKKQVNALVDLAVTNNFNGLDLDYEKIAFGPSRERAAMRGAYTKFIAELGTALRAKKKVLTVAVMAKTADKATSVQYVWDYAALGRSVDRLRIMTYDYGWSGGSPNAIAPLPWVKTVTAYAKKTVPAAKIQMGIPLYGYNWGKPGVKATSVTYPQAVALMAKYKAARKWSATNAAPYFTYKDEAGVVHTVHYMDRYAVSARMLAAKSLGLGGVTFWAFGQEDPRMWQAARDVIKTRTLAKGSVAMSPTTIKKGATSKVVVNTGAAYAGRSVAVQQYKSGKWVTISNKTLTATGKTSVTVRPGTRGTFKYRAYVRPTYYRPAVKTPTAVLTVK